MRCPVKVTVTTGLFALAFTLALKAGDANTRSASPVLRSAPQAAVVPDATKTALTQLKQELAEARLAIAAIQRQLDEEKRKIRLLQQRVLVEQRRLAAVAPPTAPTVPIPPNY